QACTHVWHCRLRETFEAPRWFPYAAPQPASARCPSARRRSRLSQPAWFVALALLPTTSRRRWSVLACAAWSERVARNPWPLVGTKRNRPIPHACVPDVRKPPCRLCDLLPESNESCRLLSHSRNTRSRYARDLESGLRGSAR